MPILKLTQSIVDHDLKVPPNARRIEFCDADVPGLLLEVRQKSTGNGTWYLRFKRDGKTGYERIGTTADTSLAEARRRAKVLKAELQLGKHQQASTTNSPATVVAVPPKELVPTLAQFFDEQYLPHVKPRKRSWTKDLGMFNKRVRGRFGDTRIDQLKRQELQTWHAELLSEGVKPATADHHLKLIRQMLNMAVEWSLIEVNPIARVKLFNADNRLENYMTPEELQRLIGVLKTYESNRAVCNVALFLMATGARLNEALAAKWADIDREARTWRIAATTSKSKKIRSVPLNDAAIEILDQLGTDGKGEHVFVSDNTGKKLTWVHKTWCRIREKAGLPNLRLHDLRHQYASFLVNSGRSLYEVQKILGHSSHSVTERYAHLSSKSLMDAANAASIKIKEATKPAAA